MAAQITKYSDIPGWFYPSDRAVFDALLSSQDEPGDLLELGAYLGRSAVIIADHLRPGERFVVVDLFGDEERLGSDARDNANRAENQHSYKTLTRQQFEANYLALHSELPTVIQGLSSEVVEHVAPGSLRFVHVDASHLYDQVRDDVINCRSLLRPNGVVVFDDYRSEHTPGVSAAVWEAVANDGLRPFALTAGKMYGTWGDPEPWLEVVRGLPAKSDGLRASEQVVRGNTLVRLVAPAAKPAAPPKPPAPLTEAEMTKLATRVADMVDKKAQARAKAERERRAKTVSGKVRRRAGRYVRRITK